jgi:hypothetical protein
VIRIKPFNRLEITSSDLDFLQDVGQEEIRSRLKDSVLAPGILIPATATIPDIDLGVGGASGVFGLSSDGSTLTVGLPVIASPSIHVAYDSDGNRIEIPAGDAVTWKGDVTDSSPFDEDAPRYTTDDVSGFSGSTPFSTGRLTITDPSPGDTGPETRFVFISYVPVTDAVALPPDHESKNGDITGASDNRKPITMLDQREGIAYAHHRINGYRVFVAQSSEVSIGADLVPVLNPGLFPAPEDSAKAIYIGKYTYASPSMSNVVSVSDATHKRPLLRRRGDASAVVGPTTRPTVYGAGDTRTFSEHMGGVGTGVVTPTNVHGLAIDDITGGGEEPDNRTYHDLTLGDGVIDTAITGTNNPIPNSTAFKISINNSSSIAFDPGLAQFATATGTPALVANGGTSPALRSVTVALPSAGAQSIFLGGRHLTEIFPTTTAADTPSLVGYVPFTSADPGSDTAPSGYNIFVIAHPDLGVGPNTAVLGKAPIGTVLGPDRLLLGSVAWDGTTPSLLRSVTDSTATATDRRSFSVVGKNQISTSGLGSATQALLGNQHLVNMSNANPDFSMGMWNWLFSDADSGRGAAAGSISAITLLRADATLPIQTNSFNIPTLSGLPSPTQDVDSGLATEAGADYGLKLSFTPISDTVNVKIRTPLGGLKPDTMYTISMQVKTGSTNRLNLSAVMTDAPTGTVTPTEYSNREILNVTRDGTYRRVTTTLKTNSSGNVPSVLGISPFTDLTKFHALEIRFKNDISFVGAPSTHWGDISITSVVVTEGEWVSGNRSIVRDSSLNLKLIAPNIAQNGVQPNNVDSQALTFRSRGQSFSFSINAWIEHQINPPGGGPIVYYTAWPNTHVDFYMIVDGVPYDGQSYRIISMPTGSNLPAFLGIPLTLYETLYLAPGVHSVSLRAERIFLSPWVSTFANNIQIEARSL